MSNPIQSLDSIAPMDKSKAKKESDPVKVDYEEGKAFLENKDYGQAAVALHNALVGFEEKGDESGIANASNQLGDVCLGREEFDSALTHYQRTLEICDKSNDRMSILSVMAKMVDANKGLEKYDVAVTLCLEILDHYQDNRDPQGTVDTLEGMADIYIAQREKSKAADAYRTISSIHKNFKHDNIAAKFIEKAEALER
ncbi:MAG: tetratricopeptide (TPR) repeat protein [Desulforhopalus sp.]|jgi:tetratricopeptide (TPR) repeat protein